MTVEALGLTLLRPWWLLALPVIALFGILATRRSAASAWSALIDPALAQHLEAVGYLRAAGRSFTVPALCAVAALGALALAGPATRSQSAPALRNLDTVVVAVDLSRSMTEGGSLDTLKAATARLLANAAGRPMALVLFAAEAYVASSPTDDPQLLETLVAVLDADTMPTNGSRPDSALALARDLLAATPEHRRDVVLVSDGGGIGPAAMAAAQELRSTGATVSTLFVAPESPAADMPGADPDALERLARSGGGLAVTARAPGRLEARLRSDSGGTVPREVALLAYDDHGRALLLLALLPALVLFRWR